MAKEDGLLSTGLYSKNKDWSYEKEVRLVRFKEKDKKVSYFYQISPLDKNKHIEAYISQIIVGYKFPVSNMILLKTILREENRKRKKYSLPKIKLFKTELDDQKPFSLRKKPVKY